MKTKGLFVALMALICSMTANANEIVEINGLKYELVSGANEVKVCRDYFGHYSGNIVIPETVEYGGVEYSVTSIGYSAFSGCSGLTSVTIPNSVTSIGNYAFEGCTGLTSVTIPNSVTRIEGSAFEGCTGLTSVTIGNSVTNIGERMFYGCTSLTSVTIPNSVKIIGEASFYGCTSLTSVTMHEGVIYIVMNAFDNCTSLTSIDIPNSVTSIGTNTFYRCTSLTSVTIGTSVKSIGPGVFMECSSLTSVTIPNSVTSIEGDAFSGCSGLTSVTIPNSVTSIEDFAFAGCSGLTSISVESGNTVYDSRENCNAIINSSTNELIAGCQNTIIPSSVTTIGGAAFYGCTSLTSVTIPNRVTSIGNAAFYECTGLTSVTIGNGVTSIGESAFYDCTCLTSVTIPNSVTSIGESAFYGCTGLTSVTIPNSVTSIRERAFSGCTGLTSVTIPNSVTSIGNNAFYECSGLKAVHISDLAAWCNISFNSSNPLYYAHHLYLNNQEIKDLVIPDGVTSIGAAAFADCSGLTSVTIPNSVTNIGNAAFSGCELKTVVSLIEEPFAITGKASGGRIFSLNTFNNATLYVPVGTIDKYKATEGWKDFMFIEEGDGGGITPETKLCAKPTIHYQNGLLSFKCTTEGAEFKYDIADSDVTNGSGSTVNLNVTYHISVYATREGYTNSETATATLCWIDVEPQKEGITGDEDAVTEVKAMPVLIQSEGGALRIDGAQAGTPIRVYDLSGKLIGNTTAAEGATKVNVAAAAEKVVVVKVGERSVKVRR